MRCNALGYVRVWNGMTEGLIRLAEMLKAVATSSSRVDRVFLSPADAFSWLENNLISEQAERNVI